MIKCWKHGEVEIPCITCDCEAGKFIRAHRLALNGPSITAPDQYKAARARSRELRRAERQFGPFN